MQGYPNEVEFVLINKPSDYLGDFDFDAYFLDIELPDMDGFEFAMKIQAHQKNAVIIFVTNHRHLVFDSFTVHPFDFIVKHCSDQVFQEKINNLENQLISQNKTLQLVQGCRIVRVRLGDIIYMQKIHNDLYIKLHNHELHIRKSIKEINKILPKNFFKIDSATIVNLVHVKKYEQNAIVMSTNEKLRLNRRGKKHFKKAYMNCQWRRD